MAKIMDLIWVSGEAEYFLRWDWTGGITLNRFDKFDFARRPEGKPANEAWIASSLERQPVQ
ncbi:hypothetical protein [Bradyrhizobium sp.]|jgi:hypothetical protein|uniref:hypothetical protein n=1 Tax=Bradyrhizobium sp. TaxID=376 RepID=UPI003D0A6616